jgi:hypothetical protein
MAAWQKCVPAMLLSQMIKKNHLFDVGRVRMETNDCCCLKGVKLENDKIKNFKPAELHLTI